MAIYLVPGKAPSALAEPGRRQLPCGPKTRNGLSNEVTKKSPAEIEADICARIGDFKLDHMGREPKRIHVHLIGDLVVVHLESIFTQSERFLLNLESATNGWDPFKQVRTQLIEAARPHLEAMVQEITGVKLVSLHYDINAGTGEEVLLFTLTERST